MAPRSFPHLKTKSRFAQVPLVAKVKTRESLTWPRIGMASHYLLSLARDPEMSSTFLTIETPQNYYLTPDLPPGDYYYRVEGYEGEKPLGKTKLERFTIAAPAEKKRQKNAAERPSAPVVV